MKLKQKQQTKLTVDKKIKEMFDLHFDEKQPFQRKCEQTEKSFSIKCCRIVLALWFWPTSFKFR